ncbi:MAG: nucleotide exchange factor GrpE [Verrucomicrobiota bacterium]
MNTDQKESAEPANAEAEDHAPQAKYELVDASTWKLASKVLAESKELQEKAARRQAEFDNYRKRLEREKSDAVKYANTTLLEELLPVIDNFELGLAAADSASDAKSIAMGMKMVKSQLDKFIEESGMSPIDAVGREFDPNLHEAISHKESHEHPDGTVIEQSRKGYKMGDRLIRPATVIVAKTPGASK